MSEATASQLLAQGVEIPLVDGTTERVVFTMFTLAAIEEEYGSIEAVAEMLSSASSNGQMMQTLGFLLANAMEDETWTPEQLLRKIALRDMPKVLQAVQTGIAEAFPKETAAQTTNANRATRRANSRGSKPSTSGRSSGGSRAPNSGD